VMDEISPRGAGNGRSKRSSRGVRDVRGERSSKGVDDDNCSKKCKMTEEFQGKISGVR
jgi:hypothetical protein